MRIAIIGNPNCGKTTLYNRITGSHDPVGNRMGVTVSVAEKVVGEHVLTDLPGAYSIVGGYNEETVTAKYLEEDIDIILNVVDVRFLERSLILTSQLVKKNLPTLVVLTMTDLFLKKGGNIDSVSLSEEIGLPVVTSDGLNVERIISAAAVPKKISFSPDCASLVLTPPAPSKVATFLDGLIFHKYLSLPLFFLIMGGMIFLSTYLFGELFGKIISSVFSFISGKIKFLFCGEISEFWLGFLLDGALAGVGSVASFLPMLVGIYFLLNLLEECGYLPRVAVIFDGLFSSVGVSGKATISFLLGCGCTVPALLSTHSLDRHERKKCAHCISYIPCSAKLPVLVSLLSMAVEKGYFLAPLLYPVGFLVALLFLRLEKGSPVPFLLEIPPLRLPSLRSSFTACIVKLRSSITKICSVVFLSSVTVYLLSHVSLSFRAVDIEDSALAVLGKGVSYLLLPLGLTDWRIAVSYLSGLAGKETVLSTLSVLSAGDIGSIFTPSTALTYSLLLLLSPPCASALFSLARIYGKKEFLFRMAKQTAVAYSATLLLSLFLNLIFF